MFSKIFLSKEKLFNNIAHMEKITPGKICAMIKANVYGHGTKEILPLLSEKIDYFGVSSEEEAIEARAYTDKTIIVFGLCEDYKKCMENDISFAVFSLLHIKKIVKIAQKYNFKPKMHLCINSGMNRYGIRSTAEFKKIIDFLKSCNLELEGLYTHFSSLTTDREYTQKQKDIFMQHLKLLPPAWETITHIGGGKTIFEGMGCDVYRMGIELYGYEVEGVTPILSVESQIVSIQNVKKGEHVGYLCGYTAPKDVVIATVPLGYADGFPRKISNQFKVTVNGRQAKSTGNICMDTFMIDVTGIKCQVGDKVVLIKDAYPLANLIDSTEYEVLTNLNKFRGQRIVIDK